MVMIVSRVKPGRTPDVGLERALGVRAVVGDLDLPRRTPHIDQRGPRAPSGAPDHTAAGP